MSCFFFSMTHFILAELPEILMLGLETLHKDAKPLRRLEPFLALGWVGGIEM